MPSEVDAARAVDHCKRLRLDTVPCGKQVLTDVVTFEGRTLEVERGIWMLEFPEPDRRGVACLMNGNECLHKILADDVFDLELFEDSRGQHWVANKEDGGVPRKLSELASA